MTFRQFHRWVGVIALVFFLLVSITGVFLQVEQIFGEEETAKEAQAELVSPYQLNKPVALICKCSTQHEKRYLINTAIKVSPALIGI